MRRGFALPAVLAITGVVCLALLAAVEAVDSLARSARERVDRVRFEAEALDLEARTTFAALTGETTPDALLSGPRRRPLLLDGSAYQAAGGALLSVQDEAGLINLNTLPAEVWPRVAEALGAPPEQVRGLSARLADFIDLDGERRPGGAEAADYRRAGLPTPPDGPLRGRVEVLGVLGMREAVTPSAWRRARGLFVTDRFDTPINLNTAPPEALQVRYGLTAAQAARAVRERRRQPFLTLEDLGRSVGAPLIGDAERTVARPAGRYRLQVARGGMTYDSRIVLTPSDPARPFRVEARAVALPATSEARQNDRDAAPPPVPWD